MRLSRRSIADNRILIRRSSGPGGGPSLVKEGHRKVAKVEQPRVDIALLEVLENPLRWPFRKTSLTALMPSATKN
jgi:hypothetical protein